MGRINSDGWTIEVTHPDTGRTLTADVLDDPQLSPSLGPSSPFAELRAPVRKSPAWLDVPTPADMEVYLDGERQPIEELRDVEERNDRTILIGRGGVEFENRVQAEYGTERRHIVAGELIDANTAYTSDVDTPTFDSVTDQLLQEASTTPEFADITDVADTSPVDVSGDTVALYDTCHWIEGTDYVSAGGVDSFVSQDFSGSSPDDCFGSSVSFDETNVGESVTWEFTTGYAWTGDNYDIAVRLAGRVDAPGYIEIEWTIDGGTPIEYSTGTDGVGGLFWERGIYDSEVTIPPDLDAGTHTVTAEIVAAPGEGRVWIDSIAPHDTRFSYNFDNTVTCVNGVNYLDGPGRVGSAWTEQFNDSITPFFVTGGKADVTMASGAAPDRIQLSNDRGETYLPSDGTENDTTSIDVTFGTEGSALRFRTTLSGHSPNGTRNATPRENYASKAIATLETRADIDRELLLIEEDFDNDLASVLSEVAGDDQFVFSFRFVDGMPTVVWTQPGQRTADTTPDLASDPRVEKEGTPFERITVKGSNARISNEPLTASETYTELVNDRLLSGSETVYDDAKNYERNVDYEMRYEAGEIRILSSGDMTAGETYRIDYERAVQGVFESEDAPATPRERVVDVAGVTSDRQAEALAFILVQQFDSPRYRADVTLPRPDVRFDPVEAQPLDGLSLPAGVTPLEPRGTPEITPRGLSVTLGREQGLDSAARQIGEQLRQVTRRT